VTFVFRERRRATIKTSSTAATAQRTMVEVVTTRNARIASNIFLSPLLSFDSESNDCLYFNWAIAAENWAETPRRQRKEQFVGELRIVSLD
jgi:hypothetical protein